ncbi:putative cysteine peptidase [Metamycoplasma hyosynoviae]|uniref:putative cysteine peptidase n=1 Tax=Metamycoplasma hyosynoviae TaxID=29559 RepID=UPI000AE27A95|nr:C10 family peptidase [Metamycoplasma hyosynoviae]
MKLNKTLLSTLATFVVMPNMLLSAKFKQNKANLLKKYSDLILKIKSKIDRYFYVDETINYVKKINDGYMLFQFTDYYVIVDANDNKMVEVKRGYIEKSRKFKYSIFKRPSKLSKKFSRVRRATFVPEEDDKLSLIPNISHTLKESWWWASRNNEKRVGYTDQTYLHDRLYGKWGDSGLCEYVAISNLLLYNELFKIGGLFTDEQFNEYFDYEINPTNIKYSSPTFRYYQNKFPNYSLVAKLWRLNNRKVDFYSYNGYTLPINEFMKDKIAFEKYEYEYKKGAYYWRTVENIKKNNPVIVSTAKTRHAFVIYGYDEDEEMLLLNWLWGDKDSIVLVNYWKLAAAASALKIFFTVKPSDGFEYRTKKLFKYENKFYTGEEINVMLNNQI